MAATVVRSKRDRGSRTAYHDAANEIAGNVATSRKLREYDTWADR